MTFGDFKDLTPKVCFIKVVGLPTTYQTPCVPFVALMRDFEILGGGAQKAPPRPKPNIQNLPRIGLTHAWPGPLS